MEGEAQQMDRDSCVRCERPREIEDASCGVVRNDRIESKQVKTSQGLTSLTIAVDFARSQAESVDLRYTMLVTGIWTEGKEDQPAAKAISEKATIGGSLGDTRACASSAKPFLTREARFLCRLVLQ
mmetsp:Transcript_19197/g.53328  ORF Transcript_19197/g.53328 Transcript_19197/m.53328 type:complete len:126 (-) Transcript_19197:473-850(-)